MAKWKLIGGIAGGVIVLGAIGNAVGGNDDKTSATGTTVTPATSTAPTASTGSSTGDDAKDTAAEKKTLPNFVGMGLQSAQDKAQAAGFYGLDSHDSLGRDRFQILDRDWKVCSQKPAAGTTVSTDSTVDFGAVKLDETCPAKDAGAQAAAGKTMPNFAGKAVKVARGALDSGMSITVNDATGDSRFVLMESNWKVCSQKPAAGAALNGQPVTFNAVKFEEPCP
ncbi:PASTA domain-containing protein [Streptomyces sp. NPDC048200]|uniref:PASTA domain-containing protein n=1 Tax=Streptomyces sp. NPDC048200 TaxID=3365512 RepID=UPI003718B386